MKVIVTTTINPPTKALMKFLSFKNFDYVIVVGDLITPHSAYEELSVQHNNLIYLSPEFQEKEYKILSEAIGWRCIQRRSIGFVHAYKMGAEIVASVDDDNIPYENWAKDCYVNTEIEVELFSNTDCNAFDPLSATNHDNLWHRGYPLEYTQVKNKLKNHGNTKRRVLVQANLWDGDPDIDAIQRLALYPECKFEKNNYYASNQISPFNSQNTLVSRSVLPWYMMLPFVGRMDDIWASYLVQREFPESVVYGPATVYQDRNEQNLIQNLKDEILGYENNLKIFDEPSIIESLLPSKSVNALRVYQDLF